MGPMAEATIAPAFPQSGPAEYAPHTGEILLDRTVPESGAETPGEINSLNLIFIVGFALLIAFLAQWISRRGGRGGRRK